MSKLLIIANETDQRQALMDVLYSLGCSVEVFNQAHYSDKKLATKFDGIVIGADLQGEKVEQLIKRAITSYKSTPIFLFGTTDQVFKTEQSISVSPDYLIIHPIDPNRLKFTLKSAEKLSNLNAQLDYLKSQKGPKFSFDELAANSEVMRRLAELAKRLANQNDPVVIEGERGVKKRELARSIHNMSERALRPFVSINCEALKPAQVDSVLFGYSGASADKPRGKLTQANGGTLYLDNICQLNESAQHKLAQVLENGKFNTLDVESATPADFRVISSTDCDLRDMVRRGEFREDLYYRLHIQPIRIPPLRERKASIADLAHQMVTYFSLEECLRNIDEITPAAIELLTNYDWPGNDRQLENTIFRALLMRNSPVLDASDFPQLTKNNNDLIELVASNNEQARDALSLTNDATLYGYLQLFENNSIKSISTLEREAIQFATEFHRGHMTRVAESLGIGRSTLYRKISEYGLDDNPKN